jgi:hypothetical protein
VSRWSERRNELSQQNTWCRGGAGPPPNSLSLALLGGRDTLANTACRSDRGDALIYQSRPDPTRFNGFRRAFGIVILVRAVTTETAVNSEKVHEEERTGVPRICGHESR